MYDNSCQLKKFIQADGGLVPNNLLINETFGDQKQI
jgi:hypothetical protein